GSDVCYSDLDPAGGLVAEYLQHVRGGSGMRKPGSLPVHRTLRDAAGARARRAGENGRPRGRRAPLKSGPKKKGRPCGRPFLHVAERTGLEPATSGVTGQHSKQLNYRSALALLVPRKTGPLTCTWKAPAGPAPSGTTGGADGTRTRDLRRDRPAF